MKFSDLQEVNAAINSGITYQTDKVTYGRDEDWEVAQTVGDCEDYALRKLHELLARGWPIEKLCMATAWCENNLGYHAVLIVRDALDDTNGYVGDYCLDNRWPWIYQPSVGYNGIKYTWDKIQHIGGTKTWVKAHF